MDMQRAIDTLQATGRDMLELAKSLSNKGRTLNLWERELLKSAMLPAVREQLDMALMQFLTDRPIEIDLKPYSLL